MKKFLSLVLALAMTFSLLTVAASAKTTFTDADSITYKEAVDVLTGIKVIDGYSSGAFQPTGNITRGAAAKIICNLVLGPTTAAALSCTTAPFKDVPANHTFAGYIAYCSQQGIISGYADGTFKPAANVTGYQFLKMLLGALGYNSANEGFTGANWSINVAKLALSLKLTSGNDGFVGSKAATREEACLYAFNTLKATMVEYATAGTTVTVGNTVVSTTAAKASKVANNNGTKSGEGYIVGTGNPNDAYMQFCEQYFSGLKLNKNTASDAYGRPATTWTYKGVKIGTYASTPDLTYTKSVKYSAIYADLGFTSTSDTISSTVYTNANQGANASASVTIRKSNDTKVGGTGTLTEVYYDSDAQTATVVVINYYAAKVSSVTAATSSADRYVTVTDSTAAGTGVTFDTESFAADDIVVVSYGQDETIASMALANKTSALALSSYTATSVTAGGTTYTENVNFKDSNTVLSSTAAKNGNTLDVYTDAYGNVIYLAGTSSADNYAVVTGLGFTQGQYTTGVSYGATLLYADGTTGTVDLTSTVYGTLAQYNIVKVGDVTDGKTALTLLDDSDAAGSSDLKITTGAAAMTIIDSKTAAGAGTATTVYGTATTIFFVGSKSSSGTVSYKVYTGIANVPTLTGNANAKAAAYCKTNSIANAVFVLEATDTGTSSTTTFVVKANDANTGLTTDGTGTYYVLDALVGGVKTTLKVSTSASPFPAAGVTAYKSYTTNSDGIITAFGAPADYTASGVGTVAAGTTGVVGVGPSLQTSVSALKAAATYVGFTTDAVVYTVDSDGHLAASSVSAIGTDLNDLVFYKTNSSGLVTNMFVITKS